ncbi:GntR family transcriptional regulator [Anaeromicrobium sediminis]|uniref:GntR family transcriptional regulator n=1 Tax=Anaeromicrobium sediminis TaxID=1478221 RepID=A0A267MMP2_9FIRM|nr:GntR family transcriptional regulator [Anaeromicrobium sediminis]
MNIEKNSGIPLYIQLKNEILRAIRNGEYNIGDRMDTERDLALSLGISRKTVSHAYKQLESEGVLVSHQGRGTYVAQVRNSWKQDSDKEKVNKFIDLAIESAFENDISTIEFLDMVRTRAREKENLLYKTTAVFVECNIEQARGFADQLSGITGFKVIPITVAELNNMTLQIKDIINKAKIIIPTFNHVNEVADLLEGYDKKIVGVAINPNLETIVKIAKYGEGSKFGLISLSKEFYHKVDYALSMAGLNNINIVSTISGDELELKNFINQVDIVIVSPGRQMEINQLVDGEKDVIPFDYALDKGSVKSIMSHLIEEK